MSKNIKLTLFSLVLALVLVLSSCVQQGDINAPGNGTTNVIPINGKLGELGFIMKGPNNSEIYGERKGYQLFPGQSIYLSCKNANKIKYQILDNETDSFDETKAATYDKTKGVSIDVPNYDNDLVANGGDGNYKLGKTYSKGGNKYKVLKAVGYAPNNDTTKVFTRKIYALEEKNVFDSVDDFKTKIDDANKFDSPTYDLNDLGFSKVCTSLSSCFYGKDKFDSNIGYWDVSQVDSMPMLFAYATKFNQPLNKWDVSNLSSGGYMFKGAESFNQPLDKWNTSKNQYFQSMFERAKSFNQDISMWDTSKTVYNKDMFKNCPIKENYKPKFNK